ncbi:uncharacterized protein [Euphorbia lathyris]|uniref:uncharacterized protein n=1 Tax=Euphorbia lathyris TaxID=212925 RepID=UPI00331446C6
MDGVNDSVDVEGAKGVGNVGKEDANVGADVEVTVEADVEEGDVVMDHMDLGNGDEEVDVNVGADVVGNMGEEVECNVVEEVEARDVIMDQMDVGNVEDALEGNVGAGVELNVDDRNVGLEGNVDEEVEGNVVEEVELERNVEEEVGGNVVEEVELEGNVEEEVVGNVVEEVEVEGNVEKEVGGNEETAGGNVGAGNVDSGGGNVGAVDEEGDDEVEGDDDSDDEDYEGNEADDDVESESYTDEEELEETRRRDRYNLHKETPYFRIGMTFRGIEEAKHAINDYAVTGGYDIRVMKSDKGRIRVRCFDCPFHLFVSRDHGGPTMSVKTVNHVHECNKVFANKRATVKWLATKYMDRVLDRPSYSSGDMRRDAKSMFKVDVSEAKCVRARQLILEQLDSSYKQEYASLEAYASECMTTNRGSHLKVDLNREALRHGRRVFWRIFVCFDALKKGWKAGCRPIIGLDGCFLKGICKGVLLVACGRDADDHFYPIAWAVVDRETGGSWEWFIQHLILQLELGKGENLSLISDMQKGLLPAVAKLLPDAEHRWCARHIHANWSKRWGSGELSKWFWACSWSTYPEEFTDNLNTLRSIAKEAAEHLVSYPPQRWCRAYFSGRSKDMIVTNNHVESFNAWIKIPREKSIYRLLDGVRLEVMGKLKDCDKEASKWKKEWSPKCMKVYNLNSEIAQMCRVEWNGDDGYEVSEGHDQHAVMLDKKVCTCREWELSGIPCPHAICALRHKRMDPLKEISMFYHISTFRKTYSYKLQPVRGKNFWNVDQFEPILPPPIVRMPGRPKKRRIRESTEPDRQSQTQKMSRSGHKKRVVNVGYMGITGLNTQGHLLMQLRPVDRVRVRELQM